MKLDYFTLLACTSEAPYRFNDAISVYPPTLNDIRHIGYNVYQSYTNILAATKFDLAEMLGIDANEINGDTLQFITQLPFFREAYIAALSFFIRQQVRYDDSGYSLENGAFLPMDDIRELRSVILQFAYIEDKESAAPLKYRNAKARKIYERIQTLKAEQAKAIKGKANPDMELSNLIGAVCAFSNGAYNLQNVWKLTIFQFYDQFIRLNTKIQMDISGVRWAAWGKDDFQFNLWHKAVKAQKGENNT